MEQVAVKMLKRKADDTGKVELSQVHGKKLKVQIGQAKTSNAFEPSVDDLIDLQQKLHTSERETKSIATWLNKVAGKRVVETGFQAKLKLKNKILNDFFVTNKLTFTDSNGQLIEKWCAYTTDASDLFFFIVEKR